MILGCVADDFTGASDAASFLQAGGANVILSNGIPEREDEDILEAQAVVIALKTRTCPPGEAVDRSMAAFSWLKAVLNMQFPSVLRMWKEVLRSRNPLPVFYWFL